MATLRDLPNIGPTLARRLDAAGISDPEALARLGAVEAVMRVRTSGEADAPCRSMLCAIEGAIRGIRWHGIPKGERDDLWRRYQERRSEGAPVG